MSAERLESWLPDPTVRTYHHHRSSADPDRLWEVALTLQLRDVPKLGRLVRWRIPATPADRTFGELFSGYPFVVLERGPRRLVSGLCGRIWTLARDYPQLRSPEEFRAWERPRTARVVIGHWVRDDGDGGAEIVSETRMEPVDAPARARLRLLWSVVGRFERLIGGEGLTVVARRAEAEGRGEGDEAAA